ncbi:Transmembrane amino acid transporter protein [Trichomonas vaginalis G3]|uniref:Transmembrane amino acid transporter protein n=1 Tax=Trichomonas vaginalis (strain ATCC PRA-98 / G3) TaxID=412133 RepID=A2ENA8_TRIV3|nr:amino acid transmembrane transporter protein [Trichomonas vaginalis G3]EAY05867.1 Transmembrane amino acid transporter protein [Trichomonas vaginalis G3]KAI5531676.1 amino acid transmembrane transporter protein [Trichomonas vaginalis G3]|eukprot:XP_001318090.1 Transmembrane amino acid transporter protein [Trichomonas vaginalis G3]
MNDHDEDVSLFTEANSVATTNNKAPQYTGVIATSLNLLNSTLGAGILSISNSFGFCGLVPSTAILTASAVLSFISASMVVKMHTISGINSFAIIAKTTLGKPGKLISDASLILFCYSCMVAYVIMGTEIIQSWAMAVHIDLHSFGKRALTVICYAFGLPILLTVPRNMTFLSYISFSCFIALSMFFFGMIYKGFTVLPKTGIDPTAETATFNLHIFNALAVHVLCYSLSGIIIPIVKVMAPSLHLRNVSCGISFFASYMFVLIPAVIGYLLFGQKCEPLILNNFEDSDPLFVIIRIACFIVLVSSYPMIGLSLLTMYSQIFFGTEEQQNLPFAKRLVCLALENAPPLLVALFLPNARPALAIGGALGGGVTNYCLPPLMYIKLYQTKFSNYKTWLMITFSVVGVIMCGIATYEAVLDAIDAFSHKI